jgi:hypothetical protein
MAKVTTVKCKVMTMAPERTQYFPYKYELAPEDLFVEIAIPADAVIEDKGGIVVVSMDGFSLMLGQVADSLDSMHKQWEAKQTGLRR